MNETTPVAQLPPLYEGHDFPVEKLDSGKFEDFVFACLLQVGDVLNLKITAKPSASGDGGFDVSGESLGTQRKACVQSKRQVQPLGSAQVAFELAKVAATAKLADSDVGYHLFICSGGVRQSLRKQLLQNFRAELAVEAGEKILNDENLAGLRKRLQAAGHDPRQVAQSYVNGLDELIAWDFHELNVAISTRWDAVLPTVEKYFRVTTVVRDFPRAQFDRAAYVARHLKFSLSADPRLFVGSLPAGMSTASAADPVSKEIAVSRRITRLEELVEVAPGELVILVGGGGVGKTAMLNLIRAAALRSRPNDVLPVVISLTNYTPGRLANAIHQELDVRHGYWHSLPDRILLLCDGLNERSTADVNTFLSEIKLLLRQKQIACIISSRADTGRSRFVLPQAPVACAHLAALTSMGIQRIAEHELDSEALPAFLSAYRTLIDRARSWVVWTPFAVGVAIKLWREQKSLPDTLGGMLQQLLQSRARRHAERAPTDLSPETLLQLAQSLAFESLVVDQRLECPESAAGDWIRRAKDRCRNSLGVADLSEARAADLLVAHELLFRTATGQYAFQHSLIAGALAAPLLAQVWPQYKHTLQDEVSDDAWIYAGQFVPAEQRLNFLKVILGCDLVLGARAAAEVPILSSHVEEILERSVAPDSVEQRRLKGIFALGHLASPRAIALLNAMQKRIDEPFSHPVNMALALAAERDYLRALLIEVEHVRLIGLQVSGGDLEIWDAAPLPVRLDLARARLNKCVPGDPVVESLNLVGFERDARDADLFERHLKGTTDLSVWRAALRALNAVAPIRAKAAVDEYLGSTTSTFTERAKVMRIAFHAGIELDIEAVFRCATAELGDENNGEPYMLIADILCDVPLPSSLIRVVEEELPKSSGERKHRLWGVAYECDSELLADYAVSCIESWSEDATEACSFFIAQTNRANSHSTRLARACEAALEPTSGVKNGTLARALDLLERLGFTEKAVRVLCNTLERLARVAQAGHRQELDKLAQEDLAVLQSSSPELWRGHIGLLVSMWVPLVAKVHKRLPPHVPLLLLHIDLASFQLGNLIRTALSDISDTAIDQALQQIGDPWTTLSALSIVCPRGPTQVRTDLLMLILSQYYAHPAALHTLSSTVSSCWCESVLEMILTAVAHIPVWPEDDAQFFVEFDRTVAQRVRLENVPAIDKTIAQVQTTHARRILESWRSRALGRRSTSPASNSPADGPSLQ